MQNITHIQTLQSNLIFHFAWASFKYGSLYKNNAKVQLIKFLYRIQLNLNILRLYSSNFQKKSVNSEHTEIPTTFILTVIVLKHFSPKVL